MARLIMFPKTLKPQHGVRCKVSAPSSAGVDSCRLHVDVGTEGKKNLTLYIFTAVPGVRVYLG